MAGRGPAPADPETRRRRNVPGRGEWVDLPRVNGAKAPKLPTPGPDGGWSEGTKGAWGAWFADPASLMWTSADLEAVRLLAALHHECEVFDGTRGLAALLSELRQRSDALGLTQKGKRDLRWRVVGDELAEKREETKRDSPYAHLRSASNAVARP